MATELTILQSLDPRSQYSLVPRNGDDRNRTPGPTTGFTYFWLSPARYGPSTVSMGFMDVFSQQQRTAPSRTLGLATIALLFPGYLCYHFAIGNHLIPPVLGGFFAITATALFPFLLLVLARDFVARLITPYFWCVLLFLGYCIGWAVTHLFLGAEYQQAQVLYSVYQLMILVVVMLGARSIGIESQSTKSVLLILWGIMILIIWVHADRNLTIELLHRRTDDSTIGTYQGIARSLLVTSLLILSVIRGISIVPFVLVTTAALFAIGARSEFLGFLIVIAWMMPIWFKERKAILMAAAMGFTLLVPVFLSDVLEKSSRIFDLIEISQDTSFSARNSASIGALHTIMNNPILGDFGSRANGYYAHNALSAWVTYGVAGFVLFVSLTLAPLIDSFKRIAIENVHADCLLRATFCFGVYHVTMITFAKSVADPVVGIGWGLYSALAIRDHLNATSGEYRT